MAGNSPVTSPARIMWISMGGKYLCADKARARPTPSRTLVVASSTCWRMATFDSVSRLVCSARRMGTPEPVVMASVLAKREVFKLRSNLPYSGARNSHECQRNLNDGFCKARRQAKPATTASASTYSPSARTKSDTASMATVKNGSFCLVLANTDTICGTT